MDQVLQDDLSLLSLPLFLAAIIIEVLWSYKKRLGWYNTHDSLAQYALILALRGGCLAIIAVNFRHFHDMSRAINEGTTAALIAIGNTSAVVGFGTVAKVSPAFAVAVSAMTGIPGNELIGAAIAVTVIAGLTGSASGALDSLPHNGYVVTTVRAICRESRRSAYGPIAALTVVIPAVGLVMAVILMHWI